MLIGLLLGVVIGLVISPFLRSWLAWREYAEASREARLAEDLLRRMSTSLQAGEREVSHSSPVSRGK
jgi:hypothetical protein